MAGTDLTILVALAAGVISFLSPCVLPLVPAYLGQLTAIAVAGAAPGARPSRWTGDAPRDRVRGGVRGRLHPARDHRHLRGRTAGRLPADAPDHRRGVLVVLGLNLAGILRIPALERNWRPLDAGAASSLATATGTMSVRRRRRAARASATGSAAASSARAAAGSRRSGSARSSPSAGRPCIGIILGGILTLAATSGTVLQGTILLVAYTIGLGLPFLLIAAVYDRAPRLMAPLVRHGRTVSLIGGLLVALHRRRDGLRLAGPPAALLQLQHGDLSGGPARVQPQAASATGSSARSAGASSSPRSPRS